MLFPTIEFAIFCLLALVLYRAPQKTYLLCIFNIIFYSYSNHGMVLYLLAWCGLLWLSDKLSIKKMVIGTAILQLIFWKAVEAKFLPWHPLMPLGVSFFTFQGLTYLFARMHFPAHRPSEHLHANWSFAQILAFTGFFPTVFSGPIMRAAYWEQQLRQPLIWNSATVNKALNYIAVGCFYKLCLASYLHDYVTVAFASPGEEISINLVIGMLAYTFEIFHDFAGYSLMAIGVALLFGFSIPDNFNRPYMATNIRDFWQRWHISFSTWLRDYFYIALGGSRCGKSRQIMNAAIVMLVCGAWHGISLNYLIWGALHALAISLFHLLHHKVRMHAAISFILTFIFVAFSWVFFRSPDTSTALIYLQQMLSLQGSVDHIRSYIPVICLFLICAGTHYLEPLLLTASKYLSAPLLMPVIWSMVFIVILMLSPSGMPPFIYFTY